MPQFGRHASVVLGLDLGIVGGRLQFFYGLGELPGSFDLIGRLRGMVEDLEARAEQAQAQTEQAQAQAEQAQAQAEQALATLRDGLLTILAARQLPLSEAGRARILACVDLALLRQWLVRAATMATGQDVLGE